MEDKRETINGLEFEEGFVHEEIDFNTFKDKATKIPEGYTKVKVDPEWVKEYHCDPSRRPLLKDNEFYKQINHPKSKTYYIHDNGGRPLLVYVSKNEVHIYKKPDKTTPYFIRYSDWLYDNNIQWTYIYKVASYEPMRVFIGESPKTEMTEFSGGYGLLFYGNSILLQIDQNRYVFIGWNIYEFSTNDQIKEFISPVGGSDVPYPTAIGEKNVYFMLDSQYVPINEFATFNPNVKRDAYAYFYGRKGNVELSTKANSMLEIKNIHRRC